MHNDKMRIGIKTYNRKNDKNGFNPGPPNRNSGFYMGPD